MIRSFRHAGLRRLCERDDASRIKPSLRKRVARIVGYLDVARAPKDMDFPGLRLHPLTGNLKGFWSVTVSANWRIIFRFEGTDVIDVDLVDYH